MDKGVKRKAIGNDDRDSDKRQKTKKQWRVPRSNDQVKSPLRLIQPGDSGIWATCNKGRESRCVAELRDLFNDYAEHIYGNKAPAPAAAPDSKSNNVDIEAEIKAEVSNIRDPIAESLFTSVRIDTPCLVFFKTRAPIEPVTFVQQICEDAIANAPRKRTRYTLRLSPVTLMARASEEGLQTLVDGTLAPHFNQESSPEYKYAIRPTLRNHNELSRDRIIKHVAAAIDRKHKVDLTNYDKLVIVEVYQNVCGMSIVNGSFERLKRYNLSEIFSPTEQESSKPDSGSRIEDRKGIAEA